MPEFALPSVAGRLRPLATWLVLSMELLLAVGLGLGLVAVGLGGAAWILGGMVAGAIGFSVYRSWADYPLQPNRNARKVGQMIIGLSIGLSLQPHNLETLGAQLPIFLGLPLFLLLAGAAIGIIYARIEKVDLLTALLATTPGNIGVMATIAADYSKNTALVSLVQLLRFTTVIFLMPLLFKITAPAAPESAIAAIFQRVGGVSPENWGVSSLVLAIAAVVSYIGNWLKIPLAAFLGAIGVGLLIAGLPLLLPSAPPAFQLPLAVIILGQALLGITIGEYWGLNPRIAPLTIVRAWIPVGLTLLTATAAAGVIQLLTHWSWLTCLLVTAPGGSPEMIWLAVTLHQDTEIITAGHLVRLLAINLSLPLLVSLARSLEARWQPASAESSE